MLRRNEKAHYLLQLYSVIVFSRLFICFYRNKIASKDKVSINCQNVKLSEQFIIL